MKLPNVVMEQLNQYVGNEHAINGEHGYNVSSKVVHENRHSHFCIVSEPWYNQYKQI